MAATHPMDVPIDGRRRFGLRTVAIAAITIAVVALALYLLRRSTPALTVDRATVVTAKVTRGMLVREARGTGVLVAERARVIAAETSGRIESIRVRAGQSATPDTVILVLSNPQAAEQAAAARASLALAEAQLASAEAAIAQQVLSIRADAARLEGDSEEAEARLRSLRELASEGLASAAEVHLAVVRAKSAATREQLAREQLETAQRGARAQLAARQAEVDQARAELESRSRVVESLQVRAQFDGIVQELLVEAGQHVESGANLARVADPTAMVARVRVPPAQARDIAPGLEARVDTHSGIVAGRVARVDPAVREGTVAVDIEPIDTPPAGIRPDSAVEATIVLGRIAETTLVRRPAGVEDGAAVELFRIEPSTGEGRRIHVVLGRGSTSAVEVLEGLKPGDEIVVSDTSAWNEYDRIRLR